MTRRSQVKSRELKSLLHKAKLPLRRHPQQKLCLKSLLPQAKGSQLVRRVSCHSLLKSNNSSLAVQDA